jgi:hypothetical protein
VDDTNAGTPSAAGQLSGEASKQAAIKRFRKMEGGLNKSSAPNTGGTGLPKPEPSITQAPGLINQSSTPEKKRI